MPLTLGPLTVPVPVVLAPMAGVISPSMQVYVVEDSSRSSMGGHRTFSNLNEGYGKVLRYGAFSAGHARAFRRALRLQRLVPALPPRVLTVLLRVMVEKSA